MFNTATNVIKAGSFKKNPAVKAPWRRNHIAEAVNSSMIVHGGIDNNDANNKPLCSIHLLDLNNLNTQNKKLL